MKTTNIATVPKSFCSYIEVKGFDAKVVGDPNGLVIHCLRKQAFPRAAKKYRCCVTGKAGLQVKTRDYTFCLNPQLVSDLFLTRLPRKAYKVLILLAPHEFWIHDDFYNDDGSAIQPKTA